MKGHPISQRRACVLIGVDPKTVRREHPPDNPDIRLEMNRIAEKRRRFGIGASVSCWRVWAW
jgi:putative transposase